MAIVPKKPRAAPQQQRAHIPSPPPRRRIVAKPQESTTADPQPAPQHCASLLPAKTARRRGHAQKDARGRFMPTGDYDVGFGRPPVEHRFDGSRPGPGRPKGSRSQASIEREELQKKREITENGMRIKLSQRHLAIKLVVKNALEKQHRHDLREVMEMARRHFPERVDDEAGQPLSNAAFDEAVIAQLFANMQLGEPAGAEDDVYWDPGLARAGAARSEPAWSEGDWSDPGDDEALSHNADTADEGENDHDA